MESKLTVLCTGIGGTWGREYTRQLLEQGHTVVGVDRDEKSVAEFRRLFPDVKILLQDFSTLKLEGLGIDVTVHLAAYKHIDLCEVNVAEAVDNNVTKTVQFYQECAKNNVKILYISTDKTVNPQSVYGMTKALGERLTWEFGGSVARSGNIIGSNGSVVHVWREAIKNKKPLTVTDMGMQRYFISVEDAVSLSWSGFKAGKRLTLVDKGGHLKLGDIINKVLSEEGYTLETYEPGINVVGLRDGERLIDEITWHMDKKYLEA